MGNNDVEGKLLHLRCFLDGVEIECIGANVSGAEGSPATCYVSVPDSEEGAYLHPRTLVHVFYYDNESGEPPVMDGANTGGGIDTSAYRLLFFGELSAIYSTKSANGSRSMSLMCYDASNTLDTNYVFGVDYADSGTLLGTGAYAENKFLSGQNVTQFDSLGNDAVISITRLISASQSTPRAVEHNDRRGAVGGVMSMFELLLGVKGESLGINKWNSLHEYTVRFLDMITSDNGDSATKLLDQTVFNMWVNNTVGNAQPTTTFRQLTQQILGMVYHKMICIPTAPYRGAEQVPHAVSSSASTDVNSTPQVGDSAWLVTLESRSDSKWILPEFKVAAAAVLSILHNKGWPVMVTDGFRTNAEAEAGNIGAISSVSSHSRGIAYDIDIAGESKFTPMGNVVLMNKTRRGIPLTGSSANALTAHNKGGSISGKIATRSVTEDGKEKAVATALVYDGNILHSLLNRPASPDDDWLVAMSDIEKVLFGGKTVRGFFQFINYMLAYPFMVSSTSTNKEAIRNLGKDDWIKHLTTKYAEGALLAALCGDGPLSVLPGMKLTHHIVKWFSNWTTINYGLSALIGSTATESDLDLISDIDIDISVYWDNKVKFWADMSEAVIQAGGNTGHKMKTGASGKIMVLSGESSPFFDIIGCPGDDPVHVQSAVVRAYTATGNNRILYKGSKSKSRASSKAAAFDPPPTPHQALSNGRLNAFIILPDIWMCAPPKCNVIFPDDVVTLNAGKQLLRQTTRMFLTTTEQKYADNLVFNKHFLAPKLWNSDKKLDEELVMPHEVHSGIIPQVHRMNDTSIFLKIQDDGEHTTDTVVEDSTEDGIYKYGTFAANHYLFKKRFAASNLNVDTRFLPNLVPGMPCVVIGAAMSTAGTSSSQTWLGTISSLQHNISQAGGTTSVSLVDVRPYNTGAGSVDALLRLASGNEVLLEVQVTSFVDDAAKVETMSPLFDVVTVPKTTREAVGKSIFNNLSRHPDAPKDTVAYVESLLIDRTSVISGGRDLYVSAPINVSIIGTKIPMDTDIAGFVPTNGVILHHEVAMGSKMVAEVDKVTASITATKVKGIRSHAATYLKDHKEVRGGITKAVTDIKVTSGVKVGVLYRKWRNVASMLQGKDPDSAEIEYVSGPEGTVLSVIITDNRTVVMGEPVILYSDSAEIIFNPTDVGADGKVTIPMEEALMPPWLSDEYRNANIDTIYSNWLGCESILEGTGIGVEDAIDIIINNYLSGNIADMYTDRDVATIRDMLYPTESSGSDWAVDGGFHSRAFGNYDKLELLGINGVELRQSVGDGTDNISPYGVTQKGSSIDPRMERLTRVLAYRNSIVNSRGKKG